MSDLAERFVIVAGGAGEVGEGIVAALLRERATVLVPSRSAQKLAALQVAAPTGPGRLSVLEADIGTEVGRAKLRAAAEAGGPLRAVVACVGGFWQGPPTVTVPPAAFAEALDQRFFPHLYLAQTLIPLLRGSGTGYVQINGLAAVVSFPGSSALSVSTAAQLALTRSLIADAAPDSPRITSLVIEQWVRTRSRQGLPDGALTADEVGAEVVRVIRSATTHGILRLGKADGRVFVGPLSEASTKAAVQRILSEMTAAGEA